MPKNPRKNPILGPPGHQNEARGTELTIGPGKNTAVLL